jgi:hypothetical protein
VLTRHSLVAAAVREQASYNTIINKLRPELALPPPDASRQMIVEEFLFRGKIVRDNNIGRRAG